MAYEWHKGLSEDRSRSAPFPKPFNKYFPNILLSSPQSLVLQGLCGIHIFLAHPFLCETTTEAGILQNAIFYYFQPTVPVRRTIHESQGIYFITFTCARWVKLFQLTQSYDLDYNWFNYLIAQGHHIIGYVIMPNHVHALIAFKNSGKNFNRIVGNGKRFIAYDLVERLKAVGFSGVLETLQGWVNATDRFAIKNR